MMPSARTWLSLAVLAGSILAVQRPTLANDAVLYRCTDANGITAYTNTREGFSNCQEAARYPRPRTVAPPPAPAAGTSKAPSSTSASAATSPAAATAAPGRNPSSGQRIVRTGTVYRFGNDDGIMHYTNVQPGNGAKAEVLFTYTIETCIACQIRSAIDWNNVALRLDEYRDEIAVAAAAHGVDEALVRAVIHAESAFRANARSHKAAQGLMQLIPATAERFGVNDPYDPAQNINGGAQYLAWLLKRFNNDVRLATAGYNAGEGAVDRHGGVPPYAETQVYVERVGILHARYRAALDAARRTSAAADARPVAAAFIGTAH